MLKYRMVNSQGTKIHENKPVNVFPDYLFEMIRDNSVEEPYPVTGGVIYTVAKETILANAKLKSLSNLKVFKEMSIHFDNGLRLVDCSTWKKSFSDLDDGGNVIQRHEDQDFITFKVMEKSNPKNASAEQTIEVDPSILLG